MTIEEDMFYDRKRKEVMSTPKDASLKLEGKERHIHGREIPQSNITVCMCMPCFQFIPIYVHSLLVTVNIKSIR